MGSVVGVVVGAAIIVALPKSSATRLYRLLAFGAILMVLMIFRPGAVPGAARDGTQEAKEDAAAPMVEERRQVAGGTASHAHCCSRRWRPRRCHRSLSERLGHRVTVIERQPGAALETSFGNGAVIHASEVEPWSQPGMPLKILKWLGREDAPMLLRLKALPHILRWGPAFLANCTEPRFVANATANLRLALYSLKSLQEIREETGIEYDLGTKGVLKIYRNPEALAAARRNCAMLAPHGLIFEELSPAQCTVREPALEETGASLCGALYFPRDEVGDCHKFVQELARYNEARGIAFRYSMSVTGLVRSGNRIVAVATSPGHDRGRQRRCGASAALRPLSLNRSASTY
jgi:hypothetical protein